MATLKFEIPDEVIKAFGKQIEISEDYVLIMIENFIIRAFDISEFQVDPIIQKWIYDQQFRITPKVQEAILSVKDQIMEKYNYSEK